MMVHSDIESIKTVHFGMKKGEVILDDENSF